MREGGLPEWGCIPALCPLRRPPTRARAIFAASGQGRDLPQVRYMTARAVQRDWRYSMTRGTPKHLDRFRSVNTSGSGPAAST